MSDQKEIENLGKMMREAFENMGDEEKNKLRELMQETLRKCGIIDPAEELDPIDVKAVLKTIGQIETLLDILDAQIDRLGGFAKEFVENFQSNIQKMRKLTQAELRFV